MLFWVNECTGHFSEGKESNIFFDLINHCVKKIYLEDIIFSSLSLRTTFIRYKKKKKVFNILIKHKLKIKILKNVIFL